MKLVYEIPEELRRILGLKEADAVSMSDEMFLRNVCIQAYGIIRVSN